MITLLSLLACSSTPPGDSASEPVTTDLTWHQDIAPVLSRSCFGCHNSGGSLGAMDLGSLEKVQAWGAVIELAVSERTMPPWRADGGCNDYQDDLSLSQEEIDAVVEWVQGGMPEGDPDSAAELPEPVQPPTLDRVDLELQMPDPYVPGGDPDDYRCFLIDWPYEDEVWVTGFEVQPGDMETVHHVIPYIIEPGDVGQYRDLDEADAGTGYSCYGGPGGDLFTLANTRWLGSWAPGGGANNFPEGTGLKIKPGSLVAFQVHYYVEPGSQPGGDQSAIALEVETESQGWGDVQPFTDIGWVMGAGMEIPPESEGVEHTWSQTLEAGQTFAFTSAAIHMHTLGRSARFEVEHADGSRTCLIDVPNYDFNWQRSYRFETPVDVGPGDTLHLRCTWDNPGTDQVSWGDGTNDEMCLGVSYIIENQGS